MLIQKVSKKHSGRYICTAVNVAGEAKKEIRVSIQSVPTIFPPSQTMFNLIQGQSIHLPCDADGDPPPDIKWFLNNKEFNDGILNDDGTLIIEHIGAAHRGDFKCIAENELGSSEHTITLKVHIAPIIEGSGTVQILFYFFKFKKKFYRQK